MQIRGCGLLNLSGVISRKECEGIEDNKNEMSITEAIERCDIMLNAISINGAEKGFANDDNGFPDCVVMKSLIRRCKWALKRQIPKKPYHISQVDDNDNANVECPECHATTDYAVNVIKRGHCWKCGQLLDWSDDE